MKQCPNCGARIDDDSRFCAECGKELTQTNVCPHCGASVGESDAFCQNCGKSLKETSTIEQIVYNEEQPKNGFKKYLPYIIGAFVLLGIIGYFSSNDSSNQNNSTNTVVADSTSIEIEASVGQLAKEQITKRLEEIFDDVVKGNTNDYDERYFSSDFNRIYNEVAEIDNRFAQEGELGFWDSGFWDMAQDEVKLSTTIKDVYDVKDKEAMAKIAFKFTYFDGSSHDSNEDIKVVLENGKWVLDDIHDYKKQMKAFVERNKDFQPSTTQNDTDWLQGHWVYEQGNYKGHFIIQGDTFIQYSSMNPGRDEGTYSIDGDVIRVRFSANDQIVVKIDYANHTIDYGDGNWMHKVE